MTPNLRFNGIFELHIPSRDEWSSDSIARNEDINIYTDDSKMERGTGVGIYSDTLGMNESIKMRDSCSVFQAEVGGILTATKVIKESVVMDNKLAIYSDSQAAIRSLGNNTIKSKIVAECFNALNDVSSNSNTRI